MGPIPSQVSQNYGAYSNSELKDTTQLPRARAALGGDHRKQGEMGPVPRQALLNSEGLEASDLKRLTQIREPSIVWVGARVILGAPKSRGGMTKLC